MATEYGPSSVSTPEAAPQVQPWQAWLARLGINGKLLALGGLVGLVAVFLPWLSFSMQMPTIGGTSGVALPVSTSQSIMVLRDWRGVLCLVGYLATLGLTFVLYRPSTAAQKNLTWAVLGVGGVVALLALWLLFGALSGSTGVMAFGASLQISIGLGTILNLLAAGAVATGGFLRAREEKLF